MGQRSGRNSSAGAFQNQWRFGGPDRPPVPFSAIRGEWFVSRDLTWPALVWNEGRCWAYLHDLEPSAREVIMCLLREAEMGRSHPHGLLAGWTD